MQRPCSRIRCPMNASTCKCTGIEGCEYYTPQFDVQEVIAALRYLADYLEAEHKKTLSDLKNAPIVIPKE